MVVVKPTLKDRGSRLVNTGYSKILFSLIAQYNNNAGHDTPSQFIYRVKGEVISVELSE